jgi:hypothetical protein
VDIQNNIFVFWVPVCFDSALHPKVRVRLWWNEAQLPMNALLSLYSGPNRLSNFVQNFSLFGAEAYYAIWTRYVSLRSFNTTQEFRPLFHSTKGCAGCHPQVLCLGLGPDFVQ